MHKPLNLKNELEKITDKQEFSGFFSVINDKKKRGVLFIQNGKLTNACISNDFYKKKASEILEWNTKDVFYKEWSTDFEVSFKYIYEVLCYVELFCLSVSLDFVFKNKQVRIFCSEGSISKIEPQPNNVYTFFYNVLNENKGKFKIKKIKPHINNQIFSFTEIINTIIKTKKKSNNKTPISNNIDKKNNEINILKLKERKINNFKNKVMDVKKLNQAIEVLKEDLNEALISSDIWITGTGQSIAAYKTEPKATALFEQVSAYMKNALKGAGFPGLNKYYMLDLEENSIIIVLQFEKYQWGMLVNAEKVQLGLLLNIAIPNARKNLKAAIE